MAIEEPKQGGGGGTAKLEMPPMRLTSAEYDLLTGADGEVLEVDATVDRQHVVRWPGWRHPLKSFRWVRRWGWVRQHTIIEKMMLRGATLRLEGGTAIQIQFPQQKGESWPTDGGQ